MHQRQKRSLEPRHGQVEIHPCMVLRLSPAFYHVILLPRLPREQLLAIARTQVRLNRIWCCLVLGPEQAWHFGASGEEVESSFVPTGGIMTGDRLKPCIAVREDEDLRARRAVLKKAVTKTGFAMGDTTKGGRIATPQERKALAGVQRNGVPKGLKRCPTCGAWRGTCLDPNPEFAGKVMKVHCACENDNRCAWCGELLYEQKLNANFYDPESRQIWHVPGFMALKHSCTTRPGAPLKEQIER